MLWTYRVFRDRQGRHSIREIFCDRNHQILKISPAPVTVVGSSAEDLLQLIQWFKEALNYPFFPSKRLRLKSLKSHLTSQPLQPRKFPYSNSSPIRTPTPLLNKEINQNSTSLRFLRTKSRQSNKSSPAHFPA